MNWYLHVLKNYGVFKGRATRAEYWYFTLFNFLAFAVLSALDGLVGFFSPEVGLGVLGGLYSIAVLIPYLAVTVRRLHDTDRSGAWLFIELLPVIGGLVLFIFMLLDSQTTDNQYGPNPKPGNQGGSSGVIIAAVIIVFVAFIGILAAIAIPAYQNYVDRVQQLQPSQNQPL
ncbi:MAG: DUF805 domain-containing protein [Methylococcales bacterium]|nr:DUF805 domain-containing protein [Methylococcales bacterium]